THVQTPRQCLIRFVAELMRPGSHWEQGEERREFHNAPSRDCVCAGPEVSSPLVDVPFLNVVLLPYQFLPVLTGWPKTPHSTHTKSNSRRCGAWRQGYTYHQHTQRRLNLHNLPLIFLRPPMLFGCTAAVSCIASHM